MTKRISRGTILKGLSADLTLSWMGSSANVLNRMGIMKDSLGDRTGPLQELS